MNKLYINARLKLLFSLISVMLFCVSTQVSAQTTINTTHTQNNGASMITFNVRNNNNFPIIITEVNCFLGANAANAIEILYNPTPIMSAGATWNQGTVGAGQNGWVSAFTGTLSTTGVVTAISGNTLTIVIPANSTYGMCVGGTTVSYMTLTAGSVNVFSGGGVDILTGDNISWGGGIPPATPVNYPRGLHGGITFIAGGSSSLLPPIANFYTPDTVWINSPQTLLNTSSFQSRVFWNLPDENPLYPGYNRTTAGIYAGYIDTAKYSNHFTYTFTSPGLKRVKLLAVNNAKRDSLLDSIVKFIYVDTPSQKPRADFISFKRKLGFSEEAPLIDLSTNGPNQWEWSFDPPCATCATDPNAFPNYFNPSNTVSNPRIAAFDPGTFRVCLRVWNDRGTDSICKPGYIQVFTGINMCAGTSYQSSEQVGFLYGVSGPYTSYARSLWSPSCPGFTIAPCADSVILYVERIKMLPGDSIEIFNGPNTSAPRIRALGASTTGQLPLTAAQSVIRGGSSLSFKYKPGSASIPSGYDSATFAFRWEAKAATYGKPTANFNIPDTFYSNQPVSYVNTSTGTLMQYSWDTDGNGLFDSTSANPTRTFLITTPLSRVISMVAYNCVGSDTIRKTVTFLPINRAPIARFTADKFLGFNTDTFRLLDQSIYGVTQWKWVFSPNAVQFINGTSATSQSPQVRLTSPVAYTIRLVTTNNFGIDSVTKTAFIQINAYQTPGAGTVFSSVADATMGITRVRLSSVDSSFTNPTSPTYQYINTKTQLANVNRGGKYAIVVNRPNAGTNMDYKVWIDLNFNASFENNELILNKINNGDAQLTDTIIIPATQGYGTTRMRVGTDLANSTQFNSVYSVIGMFKDFNVAINKDNVKPSIVLNGTNILRTEINKTFNDPWVLAMDNIEGNVSGRVETISTVDTSNLGVYTVKYFVKDYSGNVSDTLVRTVIVELNNTGPILILTPPTVVTLEVNTDYIEPGFIALDNTGNDVRNNVIITTDLNKTKVGNYTMTYSITDAFNFNKTMTRTIEVRDRTAPVITKKYAGLVYKHQINSVFNPLNIITATDNYDKSLSVTFNSGVNPNNIGQYFVVYNVTDSSGNAAVTFTASVEVSDYIKPGISLNGNQTEEVEVYEVFNDPGVSVSDNYCHINTLVTVVTPSNLRTDSLGTFMVTYVVTDCVGNKDSVTRNVSVVKHSLPVIKLLGTNPTNMLRFCDFVEPGFTVEDRYYSGLANNVIRDLSALQNDVPGVYPISYVVTDPSGNRSVTVIRQVSVSEQVCNTGLYENVFETYFNMYPSPSKGMVYVEMKNNIAIQGIEVYTVTGQLVQKTEGNTFVQDKTSLDMSSQSNGLYFMRIVTEKGTYSKSFVINK
ncbi:MAG: immunoglobulin-like domain-containing protein [Bacteroidota bacterium]